MIWIAAGIILLAALYWWLTAPDWRHGPVTLEEYRRRQREGK